MQSASTQPNAQQSTAQTQSTIRPTTLLLISAIMAAMFYVAFTRPYSLAQHGEEAGQTFSGLSNLSSQSALLYVGGFAVVFGLYLLAAQRLSGRLTRAHWAALIGGALLINAVLLPLYPLDADDVYDNIIRGRMTSVYGLNPLRAVPNDIANDPFYRFTGWRDIPSAYGPGWELLSGLTSKLAGDDNTANVIAYKLLSLIGYAAAALLIGLTLRIIAPERAALGVYLFAWNPLIAFTTSGTAHNDVVMAAFIAGSVYCLMRRWYVGATLAALVGTLVKFIPILLIPFIVIVALRELSMRGRLRYVLGSALLGGALIVLLYLPFGLDTISLPTNRVGNMFTGSAGAVIRQALEQYTDTDTAAKIVRYTVIGLFGLFYLWQMWIVFKRRDPLAAVRASAAVILFYLLVSATWFMAWYVTWAVVLVAVLPDGRLRRLTLVFSYLVTWEAFLYDYVTLRFDGWAPLPWRDLVPVASYIGIAWLYTLWLRFAKSPPVDAVPLVNAVPLLDTAHG